MMPAHVHKAGQPCLACRNGGRRSSQQQNQWQPQQDQYAELQSGYEGGPLLAPYRDDDGYAVPAPRQPRANPFPNQRSLWDEPEPQQNDDWTEQDSGLLNRRQVPDVLQDLSPAQNHRGAQPVFRNGRFDGAGMELQRRRCLERLGWSELVDESTGKHYWYNFREDRWQWAMPSCDEGFSNKSGLPSLLTLGFLAAAAVVAMRVSKNI